MRFAIALQRSHADWISRRSTQYTSALVVLGAISGCARAGAQPAFYSGRVGGGAVAPASVAIVPAVPGGYRLVGDVVARCRADEGVVALDREWLADVDCSDGLLVAALREKAALVGGAALVGVRCTQTDESRDGALSSALHSCSAMVAANAGAMRPLSESAPVAVAPYRSPSEAFSVRVTLVPAERAPFRRRAVPSDSVAELAFVPPGRVVVGDIVAKCSADCGRDAVRHGVRAAAGRVGATDVVGVACVRREHGFLCTGQATRPEIDECAAR